VYEAYGLEGGEVEDTVPELHEGTLVEILGGFRSALRPVERVVGSPVPVSLVGR
jgi:hypothetical protein